MTRPPNLYAESSAILAWLLGEDGGDEVRQALQTAQLVVTSDLTLIECDRVLQRGQARGGAESFSGGANPRGTQFGDRALGDLFDRP